MTPAQSYRRKLVLFHEQKEKCFWCREQMHLSDPKSGSYCTIDHLYPKGDPRRHTPNKGYDAPRVVAACRYCNQSRRDLTIEDFLSMIATNIDARWRFSLSHVHPCFTGLF